MRHVDWWVLKQGANADGVFKWPCRGAYHQLMKSHAAGISYRARFAGRPILPHGLSGIFVSSGSTVGRGAVIFQQVTIGSVTTIDSPKHGSPTIGERCYIGAGAKILGQIEIGSDVRIGANAVVYEDVPDRAVVVSGAQRTIVRDVAPDNTYYFNRRGVWFYGTEDGRFMMCPGGMKPSNGAT